MHTRFEQLGQPQMTLVTEQTSSVGTVESFNVLKPNTLPILCYISITTEQNTSATTY